MPTSQTPLDPETPLEPLPSHAEVEAAAIETDPEAPLSFVPHEPAGNAPVRFRTNRYGEMEEHELVRLLDTIEDERARGRFRESIYMSVFFWLAVAWFVFYGPRVLWHAPVLVSPTDVLKQRELTELNLPALRHNVPSPKAPPRAEPRPALDNKMLDTLRRMSHAAPLPNAPMPTNNAPAAPPPPAPTATPRTIPPPVVADAPTPQPSARPILNNNSSGTPGDALNNAEHALAKGRSGRGPVFAPSSGPLNGGVEVLSDTQGVDFDAYLRRLLADIKRNWLPLIPEEARPPLSKQGETLIRFTINPNGDIAVASMHLDGSTHDEAIDRSCWSAITSEGQFPPLPSQFHGPNLELRIHFLVNHGPDGSER